MYYLNCRHSIRPRCLHFLPLFGLPIFQTGLRDDGVDSSEVSATASATPGPAPAQPDQATCPKRSSPPAPAPRKTWKSQSVSYTNRSSAFLIDTNTIHN